MDELQVLIAIKEGDLKTFEMVFKQYYNPLVTYGTTILKNRDEAEDIVQQVFITVWNKRGELEKIRSFKPYLYRSVYNACLNRIRQAGVRVEYAKDYVSHHTEGYVISNEKKELENQIEKAIQSLPEQCGKIFRMSRYDNLKYSEIADKLGLSVKTVENQMGKALKLIREALTDYLPVLILFLLNNLDQ